MSEPCDTPCVVACPRLQAALSPRLCAVGGALEAMRDQTARQSALWLRLDDILRAIDAVIDTLGQPPPPGGGAPRTPTPGQVAYEAACRVHQELYPQAHRVPWRELHSSHTRGWDAAAAAVVAGLLPRRPTREEDTRDA
jgi:hypothetical protein